jgi:hypothetical protein
MCRHAELAGRYLLLSRKVPEGSQRKTAQCLVVSVLGKSVKVGLWKHAGMRDALGERACYREGDSTYSGP